MHVLYPMRMFYTDEELVQIHRKELYRSAKYSLKQARQHKRPFNLSVAYALCYLSSEPELNICYSQWRHLEDDNGCLSRDNTDAYKFARKKLQELGALIEGGCK